MDFKKIANFTWPIVLLILVIIPSFWALFQPGLIVTDDGNWMVIRFSSFYQEIVNFQIPVRFLSRLNMGFGYPVANFLYPGFMYFAVPIKLAGFSFVETIKIISALSFIFSGVFVFLWLGKIFNKVAAFVAAIVFTYLPYHLFDLYSRGSVGELFSFIWVAFCFWMIEAKNPFLLSLGIALLAISHNTMFLLTIPFLFAYSLFRKKLNLKATTAAFVLGILMSAFFTFPAIYELFYTNFLNTKISDVSSYFADIYLIGIISLPIIVGAAVSYYLNKKKNYASIFMMTVFVLSIFLSSAASAFLWNILPSSFIQFPFRFLSLSLFSGAYLVAYTISSFEKYKFVLGGAFIMLLVFSYSFLLPKGIEVQDDTFYSTNEATTTVMDEYMPKWVIDKPSEKSDKVVVVKGAGQISNVENKGSNLAFNFDSDTPAVVRIGTIYYPGFKASSNGVEKAVFYNNNRGLIELKLNSGKQHVVLKFGETPGRAISDVISILAFVASALIFLKYKNALN